jgi:GNAT superfamily N-acetyltransferase
MLRAVIRPFQPADAEAVLSLVRELVPLRVESTASILALARESRCWVAEDGEIVGFGRVRGRKLWLGVRQSARGRGIGGALWGRVEEHAHEPAVCWTDSEAGVAFAQARGFSPTGRTLVLVLDVAAADPGSLAAPEGVELVPWSLLEADPSPLEGSHRAAAPDLQAEGSFVALADGAPVSHSLLRADERGLGENEFTATVEAWRGRGLATLCKRASIAWAAVNGIHTIAAGNDESNVPMLAVNTKLGFRPDHTRTTLTRR